MTLPRGCLVHLSAEVKKVVHVPVAVAGRIHTRKLAEEVLLEGKADLICMGRPMLADPDLTDKIRKGQDKQIIHCLSCDTCITGSPRVCVLNPELGREGQVEARASVAKRVLVVNGGPAGIEAARVAAMRGHHVTLWDEKASLGGRWSWLIKPYITNRLKMLAQLGVVVKLGKDITAQSVTAEKPDVVIAGPRLLPAVPEIIGIEVANSVQADEVLDGAAQVSGNMVVLGAGNAGLETASFLAKHGCRVVVIEESPALGAGLEGRIALTFSQQLMDRGVVFYRGAKVTRIEPHKVTFVDENGKSQRADMDYLVIALEKRPDNTSINSLKEGPYQVIAVTPYQQPLQYGVAFKEGTSIGRAI